MPKLWDDHGKFGKDETMEEMIESCIPFWVDKEKGIDEEAARKNMMDIFPNLKRWKNLNSIYDNGCRDKIPAISPAHIEFAGCL